MGGHAFIMCDYYYHHYERVFCNAQGFLPQTGLEKSSCSSLPELLTLLILLCNVRSRVLLVFCICIFLGAR